ncbi:MAG: hypothetical protein ABI054_02205 [Planctomycetota bacterium]
MGGENLFSIGGSFGTTEIDNDDTTSINLQAAFGHFLTDVHEVGGQLNENYTSPDKGDDTIFTSVTGFYNYNFRQNPRTWFYVGPHAGFLLADAGGEDDTALAIGVHGGVRHWLSENSAVFAEPRLTFSEFDGDDVRTAEVIFGYTVVL